MQNKNQVQQFTSMRAKKTHSNLLKTALGSHSKIEVKLKSESGYQLMTNANNLMTVLWFHSSIINNSSEER